MGGHVKKPKEEKNVKPVIIPAEVPSPDLTIDGVALSVVKKADGTFLIIKVELDSTKLIANKVEVIDTATGRFEATEKFKLNVVKHGLI